MKFAEVAEWFFESYGTKRKRSWKNDRGRLKVMGDFFKNKKLGEITASDVASLREFLRGRGLSELTINHYQALLKAL